MRRFAIVPVLLIMEEGCSTDRVIQSAWGGLGYYPFNHSSIGPLRPSTLNGKWTLPPVEADL